MPQWKRELGRAGYFWRHSTGWEVQRGAEEGDGGPWVGVAPTGEELRPDGFYGRWGYRTAQMAMHAVEAHLIRLSRRGA